MDGALRRSDGGELERGEEGGVAAVLTAGVDPLIFVFDEAMAIYDGSAHGGVGRDEWVTEMVMGQTVELRLAGQSTMPPQHGTSLREGIVPGAGLGLEFALVPTPAEPSAQAPRSTPPPPTAAPGGWGSGPLAQYGHQPPPPQGAVPPPPHGRSGHAAPRRVQHNPPPPPPEW